MNILLESLSSICYHSTTESGLLGILKSNSFVLTSSIGTHSDRTQDKPGHHFYLSLSNVKEGGYDIGTHKEVKLVLDGNQFNHNYASRSVDYWGKDFRDASHANAKEQADRDGGNMSQSLIRSAIRTDENETRVYSKKQTIPNAKKYIKEIHILMDRLSLKNSALILELSGTIPVFAYQDKDAFQYLNKKKSINLSDYQTVDNNKREYTKPEYDIDPQIIGMYEWCSGIKTSPNIDKLFSGMSWVDWGSGVMADIHNNKSNPKYGKIFEKISWYMRKKGYNRIEDIFTEMKEFMRQKRAEETKKYELEREVRRMRIERMTNIDGKLAESTRAFHVVGDVDPYTHGGILFFRDGKHIDAVKVDGHESDDTKVMFTRLAFYDPRTERWIDRNAIESTYGINFDSISTEEEMLDLYANCVDYYGVENFGSDGMHKQKRSHIMMAFPTEDVDADAIMYALEAEADAETTP